MKKIILVPIIAGSALLLAGTVLFGVCLANSINAGKSITKTVDVEAYNKLNIKINTADVELKVSEDGSRKVVLEETEKLYHTVEVSNNTLSIKSVDAREWYERLSFSLAMKVTIYAPKEAYETSSIEVSTGNIIVPNDYSFTDLNVAASTGNISLETNAKNINASASTGNINLNKVNVTEDIDVSTSTGHISFTDVKAKNINASASTGHVNLKNTILENNLKIKTSTGDVKFDDSDAHSIDVETSTGDVTGTLLTAKLFDCQSNTGDVRVPAPSGDSPCKVRSSTGNIILSIKA